MKNILAFILITNAFLFASNVDSKIEDKKNRIKKQIDIEMEKEKKYAKEQTFYSGNNYDLKGAEINKDSLSTLKEVEVDDLDMDSVYD